MHSNPQTLKGNVLTSYCSVLALHAPAFLPGFVSQTHTFSYLQAWIMVVPWPGHLFSSSACSWTFSSPKAQLNCDLLTEAFLGLPL